MTLVAFVSVACDNVPTQGLWTCAGHQPDGLHMRPETLNSEQASLRLPAVLQV
jgi:hypothetical protein